MKAIILAAGQGTRVRPLTKDWPKPMVPILRKPVMDYLITSLGSEVGNYGVVVTDADSRVISFQEKAKPEEAKSTLASTGIYRAEP